MKKIRAIIIDDEAYARSILKKLIERNCPEIELIGEASDNNSAFVLINNQKPDLVFLDIHLADDNSFNLFSRFETISFEVIFTSAHSQYGVNAFKVNAIDYLLKPIDTDDLIAAVKKVLKKRVNSTEQEADKTIPVHVKDVVEYLKISQIASMVAHDNYTQIYTIEGKKYIISKTLADMEAYLCDSPAFIRIHRSVTVNSKFIVSYTKSSPCYVNMSDGKSYEISRRKKVDVLTFLKNKIS